MSLNVWTQPSGYEFDAIQEASEVSIPLPILSNLIDVEYNILTGKLPPGLRISGENIVGSAFEVARETEFKFVVRASKYGEISDRTFSIKVIGADNPEWVTPEGALPVFANQHYYVLDGNYVDIQLNAADFDTAAGQNLDYFVASRDGRLPPGLTLSPSGRIYGFVEPAFAVPPGVGTGSFDSTLYDYIAYDFAVKSSNGYDSFSYDSRSYDFSTTSVVPKKLNRNYQFTVTLTDGDTVTRRTFRIYVVTDDLFRADSTIMHVGSNDFTADLTYVRPPIWITPANLGTFRANNFQIFKLDIYEGVDLGLVEYRLLSLNLDSTPSILPPGMQFDPTSSEIFGYIPYQSAVSKTYKFTISAIRYGDRSEYTVSTRMFEVNIIGEIESIITWVTDTDLGSIDANIPSTLFVKAISSVPNSLVSYKFISGTLPPGLSFTANGEITGNPRQWPQNNLNGITNFYETDEFGDKTVVNQTFDGSTTTFDRKFIFTLEASDNSIISASQRTFSLTINVTEDRKYSNITIRPFLKFNQRDLFKSFIDDRTIFDVATIYRPNDPNFGIKSDLTMLVYAGIETRPSVDIVSVMGLNHRKKRFKLGSLKKAQAKLNGTGEVIYEVIYIDVIDPIESGKNYLPFVVSTSPDDEKITVDQNNTYYNGPFGEVEPYWHPPIPFNVTLDRTDVFAGDPGNNFRFPSSITLWRKRLRNLGLRQPRYLPLWMRSIQDGSVQELGYVPAIPLCYCKPGTANIILDNIKYSNFDFQQIDYEIDRYIIDQVADSTGDKYFVFRNDRTTIS